MNAGASMAQWSERSPFNSEVAGSILSENVLSVIRTECSTHVKGVSQGLSLFSPGAPVSESHKRVESVDRVGQLG